MIQLLVMAACVLGVAVALLRYHGHCLPTVKTYILIALPFPGIVLTCLNIVSFPSILLTLVPLYTVGLAWLLFLDCYGLSTPPSKLTFSWNIPVSTSIQKPTKMTFYCQNNSSGKLKGYFELCLPPKWSFNNDISPLVSFNLLPLQQEAFPVLCIPMSRGSFIFKTLAIQIKSKLGLLTMVKTHRFHQEITVYPDIKKVKSLQLQFSPSRIPGSMPLKTAPTEGTSFAGLRPYFPGDSIRQLDWMATARLDKPIIRTYEPEVEQPVLLLLDTDTAMQQVLHGLSRFDEAINMAFSFASMALQQHDRIAIGLLNATRFTTVVPFGQGKRHQQRLYQAMAKCAYLPATTCYPEAFSGAKQFLRRRSLVIVFTSLEDPVTASSFQSSLRLLSKRHYICVVLLPNDASFSGKKPTELLETVSTLQQAYEQGFLLEMAEQLEEHIRLLQQQPNVVVIPPNTSGAMDNALLHKYLSLKSRHAFST